MKLPIAARVALFTLALPCTVTCWLPLLLAPALSRPTLPLGAWSFAGLPFVLAGIAGYAWCALDFARAQGTPAPIDPPREVVVRGLYRHVRNPMYVSVLAVVAGTAILRGSAPMLGYAAAVWLGFHLFVVLYEEPNLRRRFGVGYGNYCKATNRWLP